MEHAVHATAAGTVTEVDVTEGDQVETGRTLVVVEPRRGPSRGRRTATRTAMTEPLRIANCSGLLRRPALGRPRDGGGRAHRRPHRRLAGRADHAHPVEGLPARPLPGMGPHLPHPDGGGARHLRRPRHQGGDQRRRPQPGRPGRPGPGAGRSAGAVGVGGPRRRRRPAPPHRRARRDGHTLAHLDTGRAAGRGDRRGGLGQRLPRRLAHRRGAVGWGRRGHLPADHRRLPGGGTGGLAPRLGADRLGPAGRRGGGRARHRVRSPGHRGQLRLLHRGAGPGASRLPPRRGGRGRLVGDHQAPGHRRRGVGRDGDRPAALRDRRPPLRQHRRGGPLRHRRRSHRSGRTGCGSPGPGASPPPSR